MGSYSKEDIRALVEQNCSVAQMAKDLDCDEQDLELFYIECFKENRYLYPLRVLLTPEWLKEKLQDASVLEISAYTGASPTAIHRILSSYNMSTPKIVDVLTPEVLQALYIEQQLSATEIAEQYKCSVDTVKKLVSSYKLRAADRSINKPNIDQKLFHTLYFEIAFSISQIAEMLNCSTTYIKNVLRPEMISLGGPLAEDLKSRKNSTPYKNLADELYQKVEPIVLLELLRENSFTKVAEIYGVIPKTGYELFTKEWLEHLLSKMNLREISQTYKISYSYVKTLKDKYNLECSGVEERLDAELVRLLYSNNWWTEKEIAQILDTSLYSVQKLLAKLGLKAKDKKPLKDRLSAEEFATLYLEEELTLQQIAEVYGTSLEKVSSLRNKYGKDNPMLLTARPRGANAQKLKIIKKSVRFKGFN